MSVNFDHRLNSQGIAGPAAAIPFILDGYLPNSVIDVGCGTGCWLKQFAGMGVIDYLGIDGVNVPDDQLEIDRANFEVVDLTNEWKSPKKFDLAICLEVAEHLPETAALNLVEILCQSSDHVIFSAASPFQPGQNHINCRWPEYWQNLFNQNGFVCLDNIREKIWQEESVEVWYRQNIFTAKKSVDAGSEKRISGMIHPGFLTKYMEDASEQAALVASQETRSEILSGEIFMTGRSSLRIVDYVRMTYKAILIRIWRKLV